MEVLRRIVITSPGTAESVSCNWLCLTLLVPFIFHFKVKHYAYSLCLFRLKKTKDIIAGPVNYQVGACGEDGATPSLDLCIRSIRENRKVLITYKGKTKNLTMWIVRYWNRLPEGFFEMSSLRVLKTWLNKVQSGLTWLRPYRVLSGHWEQMTSAGPVSLNSWFYDCTHSY